MEPRNWKDEEEWAKETFAPNAEESCIHCGLWKVKIMEGRNEHFKCATDYNHRYCEGKCSKYKKKLFLKLFRR